MGYNTSIMQYFEEQAALTPSACALVVGDSALSYAELNTRANQLARTLRQQGVGPNRVVGIMAERSLEMMIGIFGILKAGGAYLPFLPGSPLERTNYLLSESQAVALLIRTPTTERYSVPVLVLQDEQLYQEPQGNLTPVNRPDDLVYVIYTSGSTGRPKGVMIEHHSLVNRLTWMQKEYPLNQRDVLLQKTPIIFDVSVWELFWWGMAGATLCLLEPGYEKFPLALIERIAQHQVTVVHFVPTMLNAFLHHVQEHEESAKLASLRQVFTSGETLTPAHLKTFNAVLRDTNSTRLTNLYGPTEATIDVTYFDCPAEGEVQRVPIGKPIDNIELVIINQQNEQAAVMETGELCIAGVGVARGYINNPHLTAEKFVSHPWRPETKMYKTGDLARWLPDGNIEFLGRADQQVKIRGIRIEPGEIEAVIIEHGSVQQCVVVLEQERENIARLVAYIVPKADFSLPNLKKYISQILPDYMIPDLFILLPDVPLTPSGKVNRQALTKQKPLFGFTSAS